MENVVPLAAYRRRKARKAPGFVAPPENRYFCTRCDTDEFRLGESGSVHCAACGAYMRNLGVFKKP